MDQLIGIIDFYAYPSIITTIVMQRVVAPMLGGTCDAAIVKSGLENARLSLQEFERLSGSAPFLVGDQLTLADLHLAPIFAYFLMTPEAETLLSPESRLRDWWQRIEARPSLKRTEPKFG